MAEFSLKNHWQNRKTAFLGDSITDVIHVGTTKNYWQFLEEMLQLQPLVYGINGQQFCDIPGQAEKLFNDHGSDVDAVMVFAGTNDYSCGLPLGEWYTYADCQVNCRGEEVIRSKRSLSFDNMTFRGRINIAVKYHVIIDNALYASDSVIIPVECSFYAYDALTQMVNKIDEIQKVKPLEIEGILLTKLDNRNTIGYNIVEKVKFEFPFKTFDTIISVSSHIQEAPMYGKSVIQFSYNSRGSKEYRDLAKEILEGK